MGPCREPDLVPGIKSLSPHNPLVTPGCLVLDDSHRDEKMSDDQIEMVRAIGEAYEKSRRSGQRPVIEDLCAGVPEHLKDHLLRELISIEIKHRIRLSEPLGEIELKAQFPDHDNLISKLCAGTAGSECARRTSSKEAYLTNLWK